MKIEDWLKSNGYSEKILICSSVKNITRLIRKCNKKGIGRVNAECKNLFDTAREALILSTAESGKPVFINVLSNSCCTMIIDKLIRNNQDKLSFLNSKYMCSAASAEIFRIINIIRMNNVTEQYSKCTDKNISDLKTLINLYEQELQNLNAYDYCTLLRKASEAVVPDAHISYGLIDDKEYSAPELEFINKISGGKYERIEFSNAKSETVPHLFAGCGYFNEIKFITDSIKDKPFGEVNIFFTSEAYRNFIKAGLGSLKIPYTFSSSYPASETDIVSFILDILKWANNSCLYSDMERVFLNPKMMIPSSVYYKNASNIMWNIIQYKQFCSEVKSDISNRSESEKQLAAFFEALIGVFDCPNGKRSPHKILRGLIEIAKEFTYKENPEKKLVIPALNDELTLLEMLGDDVVPSNEVCRFLMERLENISVSETMRTDAVNVSVIGECEFSERKYNYICGLSVNDLSSKVSESPIMSDAQMRSLIVCDDSFCGLAENISKKPYKDLDFLVRSILADKDSELYLGYSNFDLAKITERSPSVYYKKLKNEFNISDIITVGYDNIINKNIILKKENKWKEFAQCFGNNTADVPQNIPEKVSPTMIDSVIYCPMQYFYKYKLGIFPTEFTEFFGDKWLDPLEKGNLFHDTAFRYAERVLKGVDPSKIGASADEKILNEIYENAVGSIKKPFANREIFNMEKEEIRQALLNYFNLLHKALSHEKKWTVSECEKAFSDGTYTLKYTDENGAAQTLDLSFEGRVDRIDSYIEKTPGGDVTHLRIIDYKTSKKPIDINRHSQHILYTAALKNNSNSVDAFSYETPFGDTSSTECTGTAIADFSPTVIEGLTKVFVKKQYSFTDNADHCKYCKYQTVCFKNTKGDF